jgi:hypothetical protein
VIEKLFRFLFKYPPLMFRQADFTWGLSQPLLLGRRRGSGPGDRGDADVSRAVHRRSGARSRRAGGPAPGGARGVVLLPGAADVDPQGRRPATELPGVLVDDSRSMAIADRDGQTRSDFIKEQLGAKNAKLLDALSQRFVVRMFSFSSSSDRVPSAAT